MILIPQAIYAQHRAGIFLHHSTGGNIWGPNGSPTSVPQEITRYNNRNGLQGNNAFAFDEQGWPDNPWDNEWSRWHSIFDGTDPTANINPFINGFDIVMIKSCFPSSSLTGWGMPSDTNNPGMKTVYNYKWHWRNIVKAMASHPQTFFVIWTNAPLVAAATNDLEAQLSHQFCRWAKDTLYRGLDPVFGSFPPNVYVFDFFHLLVGPDYKLYPMYAASSSDSHPNSAATSYIAPVLVEEICAATLNFDESNAEVLPPEMIYPIGDIKDVPVKPELKWHKSAGANMYRVQVSTSTLFDNPKIDVQVNNDTVYNVSGLSPLTKYWWRVMAMRSQQNASAWTLMQSFTTVMDVPVLPVLLKPADNSQQIGLKPEFTWRSSLRGQEYRLQVARDADFKYRVVNTDFKADTSFQIVDSLSYGMTYFWRVKARNIGGESEWTDYFQFKTIVLGPAAPRLVFPPTMSEKLTKGFLFRWNKVSGAQSYQINISENDNYDPVSFETGDIKDTFLLSDFDLQPGKVYFWRVRGKNASSFGSWSESWQFGMLSVPARVQLVGPYDKEAQVGKSPEFKWNPVADAGSYEFELAGSGDFNNIIHGNSDIQDTFYVMDTEIESGKEYFWHVRAFNSAGAGEWSPSFSFVTKDEVSVSETTGDTQISVTPNPATGVLRIMIQPAGRSFISAELVSPAGTVLGKLFSGRWGDPVLELILDSRGYPSGVYFLHVSLDGKDYYEKIILVK